MQIKRLKIVFRSLGLAFILFSIEAQVLLAQEFRVELLSKEAQSLELDSLIHLGDSLRLNDPTFILALRAYKEAYQLAQNYDYPAWEAEALRGFTQVGQRDPGSNVQTWDYFFQELSHREALGQDIELANAYQRLGSFFERNLHSLADAVGYYHQAILIKKAVLVSSEELLYEAEYLSQSYLTLRRLDEWAKVLNIILDIHLEKEAWMKALNVNIELLAYAQNRRNRPQVKELVDQAKTIMARLPDLSPETRTSLTRYEEALAQDQHWEEAGEGQRRGLFYLQMAILGLLGLGIGFWLLGKRFRNTA